MQAGLWTPHAINWSKLVSAPRTPINVVHNHYAMCFIFLKAFWLKLMTFDFRWLANWVHPEKQTLCAAEGRTLSVAKALKNYSNPSNQRERETKRGGVILITERARENEGTKSRGWKLQTWRKEREGGRQLGLLFYWLELWDSARCNTRSIYHLPTLIYPFHLSMTLFCLSIDIQVLNSPPSLSPTTHPSKAPFLPVVFVFPYPLTTYSLVCCERAWTLCGMWGKGEAKSIHLLTRPPLTPMRKPCLLFMWKVRDRMYVFLCLYLCVYCTTRKQLRWESKRKDRNDVPKMCEAWV